MRPARPIPMTVHRPHHLINVYSSWFSSLFSLAIFSSHRYNCRREAMGLQCRGGSLPAAVHCMGGALVRPAFARAHLVALGVSTRAGQLVSCSRSRPVWSGVLLGLSSAESLAGGNRALGRIPSPVVSSQHPIRSEIHAHPGCPELVCPATIYDTAVRLGMAANPRKMAARRRALPHLRL